MAEATLKPSGQPVLLKAAKILAMTAYDYLSSDRIQKLIRQNFRRDDRVLLLLENGGRGLAFRN
jgi:hypothetical protein